MFLGVVARHARSCRAMSCWISCLPSTSVLVTHHSTLPCSLRVHREQFQPAALPLASRRNTNHTSTDCDVHDHVDPDVVPECGSCLTLRIYFVFARQCRYEHGQKPNHQHCALEAAMSCDEGLEIKQHGSCAATHIVRLLATCPVSGQETARFAREIDLPSNMRQQRSHMEAHATVAKVPESKKRDLPRQAVKTLLYNPALPTWQTKLTLCFWCMPEQMLEMWPTCARNRDGI